MSMRIASYNVENMFQRPRAFFDPSTGKARDEMLEAYVQLTLLLEKDAYEADDRTKILEHLETLEIDREDQSDYAVLRKIRGKLLRRPEDEDEPVEVVAKGRADWVGWVELEKEAIDSVATENTAAIIAEVDPDVLAVVEAEDRMTLVRFNEYVLPKATKWRFAHARLIEGNDERGIDVGVMSKGGFPIGQAHSHVDDENHWGTIFSRDCAEYEIPTLSGERLLLMVNHFKSQIGGGGPKRRDQAQRVAEIYAARRREGWESIVIAGDLNDTPESWPLVSLIGKTDLKDAGDHEDFDWGGSTDTHKRGKRFDYLLLSPALFKAFVAGGVNRRGIWNPANLGDDEKML
ncbi:MAG TPA: endonuclease/exonuclease/phosphatase family protein, partial [Solirubrobacterales bacterium]|nr:endonuclease/exonuclease/phosphatase family protein [Solirubrobacterales bacterium]